MQWFERACFELHPENPPPYTVLLGLLGNEVHGAAGPAPALTLPKDGQWAGSTSQGKPISFEIAAGGSAYNHLKLAVSQGDCEIEIDTYSTSSTIPLRDGKISTSGKDDDDGKYTLTGQFDSAQSASGTFAFENYDPGGDCSVTMSGTWVAAPQ